MKNSRSRIPNVSTAFCRRHPVFYRSIRTIVAVLTVTTAFPVMTAAPKLDDVTETMVETQEAAAQSQQRINELAERTQDAASRYAQAMAEVKSYEQYSEHLNTLVQSQQERIASLQKQMQEIEVTHREILPLMHNMIDALAQFVALDVPFLPEERARRLRELQDMMSSTDVSIAEKYRVILQDYMIELDYGQTLGAYHGTLGKGDDARAVQFVRIGRVTLMYQTLDGSETGYWDANQKQWVADNEYAEAFKTALQMANEQGTPELLTVPVPAPQPVQAEGQS